MVEEILNWAGDGEDDMAFKYNIIRAFEDEREEGKKLKIISLVRKKIQKNNSIEEIADMLEEETVSIASIYTLIQAHPDWDDESISSKLAELEGKV